jgi:hypothetical protein
VVVALTVKLSKNATCHPHGTLITFPLSISMRSPARKVTGSRSTGSASPAIIRRSSATLPTIAASHNTGHPQACSSSASGKCIQTARLITHCRRRRRAQARGAALSKSRTRMRGRAPLLPGLPCAGRRSLGRRCPNTCARSHARAHEQYYARQSPIRSGKSWNPGERDGISAEQGDGASVVPQRIVCGRTN